MKKRFLSILLIASCIFSVIPLLPAAAEKTVDKNSAYAVLGDTVSSHNFKAVKPGLNEKADVVERGGEKCWFLSDRLGGDNFAYINFDLDDEFAYSINSGDVYEIEIDYYDEQKGYFYIDYDSQFKQMKQSEVTYLQNEGVWKTAKYTFDDAYFGGRVEGGFDFRIVIKPWRSKIEFSPGPVAVKEVRVKKIPAVNKIWATASTDESGNSFSWFDDEKIVHNTLKNLTDTEITAEVTFSAIGSRGYKAFEHKETMTFAPFEEKQKDIKIESGRCDLYDWIVAVKAENPWVDSKMQRIKFAILKTDPDGIRNEHAYIGNHLQNYYKDYPNAIEEGIDLISKSNVMGIRGSGFWLNMEPKRGQYVWDGIPETDIAKAARAKGMEVMWQLNAGHFHFTGAWNNLIRSDEEYEIYGDFLEWFVDQVKDYTTDYEIANELDLPQFNPRGLSTAELTKMISFASKIIKKKDPDARVHAWGYTWIKGEKNWDMFTESIELGMLDDLDFISYHPYDNVEVVERNGISDAAKKYLDYIHERNPNVGLSITEVGYSVTDTDVTYDERNLGSNMTRLGLHFLSREVADVIAFYNFERSGMTPGTSREDGFGMVDLCRTRATDDSGRAMTPYESYVAFTAMNYLMAQTTPDKIYDLDENIKLSSFKSKKFGGKVLAMNTVTKPAVVSLKLGCDSIRQFDDFGNEKVIYGNDGVYTFCLDDRHSYVVGDFDSVEAVENPEITIDTAAVGVVAKDYFGINASAPTEKLYKYDIEIPVNCEVAELLDVENGKGGAKVYLKERLNDYTFVDVTLTDKETGNICLWGQVKVTTRVPVSSTLAIEPASDYNVNKWKTVFEVTNNSYTNTVRGHIKINAPAVFATLPNIDIGIIPPGKTAQIEVELPPIYRKSVYNVEYDVVTRDVGSESFISINDLTVATRAKTPIVIDGRIADGEWDKNSFMYADMAEQIGNITDWKGSKDISFKAAVSYDDEFMYLYADVTDDKFFQDQQGKTTWQGDGIQIGVFYGEEGHVAYGDRSTTFHELAIAKTPNGPEVYRHLSQDNVYPAGPFEGAEAVVLREGNHTYYEVKIPWDKLLLEGQKPQKGDRLGFAMLANDNDGSGRRGWMHYAGGIAPMKNTKLFTYLMMTN